MSTQHYNQAWQDFKAGHITEQQWRVIAEQRWREQMQANMEVFRRLYNR